MAGSLLLPARRYQSEIMSLLDKTVSVVTSAGKKYEGKLFGYDPNSQSVCLADAVDDRGEKYTRVFIYGHAIVEITTKEEIIDLRELASILEKHFPQMVKYIEDARVIVIMDRIKVTEKGVEGTGPVAERVRRIFEEYLRERRAK